MPCRRAPDLARRRHEATSRQRGSSVPRRVARGELADQLVVGRSARPRRVQAAVAVPHLEADQFLEAQRGFGEHLRQHADGVALLRPELGAAAGVTKRRGPSSTTTIRWWRRGWPGSAARWASQVVEAVAGRVTTGSGQGSQATVAGRRLSPAAESAPSDQSGVLWAAREAVGVRTIEFRELLAGSSFEVAMAGEERSEREPGGLSVGGVQRRRGRSRGARNRHAADRFGAGRAAGGGDGGRA